MAATFTSLANAASNAAAKSTSGLDQPTPATSLFLLCDIQENFRDKMYNWANMVAASRFLTQVAQQLSVPIVASEQIPFKPTITELSTLPGDSSAGTAASPFAHVYKKTRFSMLTPELEQLLHDKYRPAGRTHIYLYGIETHVCILQTVLDLLRLGYRVRLVCDATTSMQAVDREIAIERFRALAAQQHATGGGLTLVSAESAMYELIADAKNPLFKPLVPLVKEYAAAKAAFASKL